MAHYIACLEVACTVFRLINSTESEFHDMKNLNYFSKSENRGSAVFPVLEKVAKKKKKSPTCLSVTFEKNS